MQSSLPLQPTTSGIHLAYSRDLEMDPRPVGDAALYRVAAVAAALLLVITVL